MRCCSRSFAGFYGFSESVLPTEVAAVLIGYFTRATRIIVTHGGIADNDIGGAAVFGAPLERPDHAARAIANARRPAAAHRHRTRTFEKQDAIGSRINGSKAVKTDMTKYEIGIGLIVFGAGLVSGMFVQQLLTPEPAPTPIAEARIEPAAEGPRLDAPAERLRTDPAARDESADGFVFAPEPAADRATSAPVSARDFLSTPERPMPPQNREGGPWGGAPWTNREAWIERMMAERETRIERMRSNLVEQARLSEQQAVRFEVLVAAMNLRLKEQAALWREAIESGAMTRPEARARAMKEIGSVVALTYDELDRNMPPDWRAATTNENINLWTFIDPELWRDMRPLMGRGRPPVPPNPATNAGGR